MSKKWNKILALSPVLIAPGFLTSCIDLVINKDLVSNSSNKKANIITTDKPIFNFAKSDVEEVKVEDILYTFGNIKDEVQDSKVQLSSQHLKNGFWTKSIPAKNRQLTNHDNADLKKLWQELVEIFEGKSNVKTTLAHKLDEYIKLFKHNKLYLTILTNWINLQNDSAKFIAQPHGNTIRYDKNKIHFGYFVENFLTNEDGWEKFKEFCLAYSGDKNNIQNYNYAKWIVNETKTFLEILDKNKDLAFNPVNEGYTPDLKELDFIKKAPTDKIRNLRIKLIADGGFYLNKADENKNDLEKFNESQKFIYSDYTDLHTENISKFADIVKAKKFSLKEEEWALGYSSFKTTEALGPWGYFAYPANSQGHTNFYTYNYSLEGITGQDYLSKVIYANSLVYRHRREEWKELKEYVLSTIPYLISKNYTEEQKLRSLHNFITWKINYDVEALNEEIRTGIINLSMRNPGVLAKVKEYEEKIKGVCETYARLLTLYGLFLNIDIGYQTGDVFRYRYDESSDKFVKLEAKEPHAWNVYRSKDDGKLRYIDLTWDDAQDDDSYTTVFNNSNILPFTYTYFNKEWEEFSALHSNVKGSFTLESPIIYNKSNQKLTIRSIDKYQYLANEFHKLAKSKEGYIEPPALNKIYDETKH
ncbi:Hypothetical protein, predicted lipoprotein [Mycoplasmopsis agalactiae 14628]|uniref:Lipoprotein n=1 Tax=Mycoplasmopsis agalactiae 14628 TaxID=1110504 RepID=I5D5H8_MYCAA|nr:hypothetical protein [Mycoplasmopsis agalactiae]EIN14937.1 Hypothetical protein, predicted lipoprotein [Mycoplasmopsis agalactiae 14628]